MRTVTLLAAAALAASLAAPPAGAATGGVWAGTLPATQGFDHLSVTREGVFFAQYLDTYARSDDAGLTWRTMPKPPGQYTGSPGIRFATASLGYSVAGTGADLAAALTGAPEFADEIRRCGGISPLRRTTDGGTTWRGVCVPGTAPLSDPYFEPGTSPLSLGNGGRTVVLTGTESPVKGGPPCDQQRDVVLTSRDSGEHWTRATLPRGWYGGYRQAVLGSTVARLTYGAWQVDSGGGCGSATTALFLSTDAGRSFRRVRTCAAPHPCTAVALPAPGRVLLGRTDGATLRSDDGGRTWHAGQRLWDSRNDALVATGRLPEDAFWVQALAFSDAFSGFASTRGAGTWRTSDGGRTWVQETSHECQWWQFGVGEVAAATPDTGITGGPTVISARHATDGLPRGCAGPPQGAARAADVVASLPTASGRYAVRVDGSVSRG